MNTPQLQSNRIFLFIAWIMALAGVFGSLFFSEIVGYPPCTLCWYQRIFLYPLALIFAVGLLTNDPKNHLYSLGFVVGGWAIALYHNLLYYGVIKEALKTCTGTVSCSSKQLELFGFITIPLLSLLAFTFLFILILIDRKTLASKH